MKISVIGTGYVGLVSGACFAEIGHDVTCVDNDSEKVAKIGLGKSPIYEKGLDDLLTKHIGKRLKITTNLFDAVINSDISIIAVGTPFDGDNIDLQYIRLVSEQIGEALKKKSGYHLVVVKSTVVPGTTDEVVLPILTKYSGKNAGRDFGIGMNPEFLREGSAISDFMYPDRIVIGGIDDQSRDKLAEVYKAFHNVDKILTNNKTAEMIKYTSNSLLATLISFSNEIGNLCSSLGGVDVLDTMHGVHLDKRISPILENGERVSPEILTYLEAGCGFGGSCFPKDVKALIAHGIRVGEPMRILQSVIATNEKQPEQVIDLLKKHFPNVKDIKIAVMGLAFKPGTDDMRESPSIPVVELLIKEGAYVSAYDPVASSEAMKIFGKEDIRYCDTLIDAMYEADAVLIMTRWQEFFSIPDILKTNKLSPLIVDGRRMLPKDCMSKYEGIGLS